MAIDPEKFSRFQDFLKEAVEMAPGDKDTNTEIMDTALGTAFGEMEELVDESRPPRLYVFGRSGAGKSSLINALANKEVAEVGNIEPTTTDSELYQISFPERYSSWDVVDSRGLFESVAPEGTLSDDTVEIMKEDLREFHPDILIHLMTPDQVRAGEQDFNTVENLREELGSLFPPMIYCLNKVDVHASPGDWRPGDNEWSLADHPSLAGDIKRNLDFIAEILDEEEKAVFDGKPPTYGYEFESEENVGVVPAYLQEEPYWNIETLSWLIGDFLPDDARLQFMQAQRRDNIMRELSRNTTKRFTMLAGGTGAAPTPVADWPILTAMQLYLVGLIGSFSCRELNRQTVQEYLSAMGGSTVAGLGARGLARSLVQFVPGAGQAISAGVAGGTTYGIGRSAEEYFFNDNVVKPRDFLKEGKNIVR